MRVVNAERKSVRRTKGRSEQVTDAVLLKISSDLNNVGVSVIIWLIPNSLIYNITTREELFYQLEWLQLKCLR